MIEALISIIILCVVLGIVYWLIMELGLPEPFNKIARICFILIALLIVLSYVGGYTDFPALRR